MDVYSIETDAYRHPTATASAQPPPPSSAQEPLRSNDSVSSALSTTHILTTEVSDQSHLAVVGPLARAYGLAASCHGRKKSYSSNTSNYCFNVFTIFTLFFFILCFVFMSAITFKLLLDSYSSLNSENSNTNNNNNNNSRLLNASSNQSALKAHKELESVDTDYDVGESLRLSSADRKLLKQILTNLSMFHVNRSFVNKSNLSSDPSVASNNSTRNGTNSDFFSTLFERNLFTWLKNTFKMSFLGKYDNSESDKSAAMMPLPANQYDSEPISDPFDPAFLNTAPFSKKNIGRGECGKTRPFPPQPHVIRTRIMNGREAMPNAWPWAVSIGLDGPREYIPHACGGTLLSKRYVITAAHCVMKNSVYSLVGNPVRNVEKFSKVERMLRLYIGVHDRLNDISSTNVYGVERITIHKDFDTTTFKNDLAIIRLDRDVDLMEGKVGFACLSNHVQVHPGDIIYAIGWGYTEKSRNQASRYLMQVDLTVQHRDNCLIQYIDNDQFCAGNVYKRKDTCNGDSGGPLLKLVNNRWTLMGVVSNGDVSCSGTGIYINVPYFYDWIVANTAH